MECSGSVDWFEQKMAEKKIVALSDDLKGHSEVRAAEVRPITDNVLSEWTSVSSGFDTECVAESNAARSLALLQGRRSRGGWGGGAIAPPKYRGGGAQPPLRYHQVMNNIAISVLSVTVCLNRVSLASCNVNNPWPDLLRY